MNVNQNTNQNYQQYNQPPSQPQQPHHDPFLDELKGLWAKLILFKTTYLWKLLSKKDNIFRSIRFYRCKKD